MLRHTFASHFIMSGGNILTLQKILGHTSLVMTVRYAHLAPDHLKDALHFGPIAGFEKILQRLVRRLGFLRAFSRVFERFFECLCHQAGADQNTGTFRKALVVFLILA